MESPYIRCPAPARTSQQCLQLDWAFGLNKDFKSVIHNLSQSSPAGATGGRPLGGTSIMGHAQAATAAAVTERRRVFYPLAHVGVLYDSVSNTQQHLLGHAYTIVATCCSHNRRFIVTCDEGDRALWGRRQQTATDTGTLLGQEEDYLATAAEQEQCMVRDPASACVEAEDDGSLMIVWDSNTGLPTRTIPIGKYGGVVSCAISPDGLYIATLNRRTPQELMIWGWTAIAGDGEDDAAGRTDPLGMTEVVPEYVRRIPAQDEQTCVRFSPDNPQLLCTNGLRRILFWSWQEGQLKYYSPPVIQGDWKVPVGNFTQSVFVPGTTMACSGTVDGDVVLWELQPRDRLTKAHDKTMLKMVRVHGGGGVTFLTSESGYLVTGGMDGHVKFFDSKLRLVAWFEDLNGGPIISISFDKPLASVEEAAAEVAIKTQRHLQHEGTAAAAAFQSPDFMVSTANAMILDVPARAFHTGDRELLRGKLVAQGQDQAIHSVAAHPSLSRIAIGGYCGNLHLWDYEQKRVVLLSIFRNLLIQSMGFDPTGKYLMVGFTNGVIKVLDAETLEDRQTFKPKRPDNVLTLAFSPDGRMLAVGTASGCIGLYELAHPRGDTTKPLAWEFIGNHKTHKAAISGLQFQVKTNGEAIRLLSVGEDKRLIEYNLIESDVEAGLLLRTAHKITQGPLPTGFLWTKNVAILDDRSRPREVFGRPVDGPDGNGGGGGGGGEAGGPLSGGEAGASHTPEPPIEEDYLLIATNEYKISAYLSDWSRQCVKTVLAPTFGGPVTRMLVAPAVPADCLREHSLGHGEQQQSRAGTPGATADPLAEKCLVYATREKVVGLMLLPLRGDPCASMGLLAHPGAIESVTLSHDGRYLFTAGGADQAVMQWRIDGRKVMDAESFGAVSGQHNGSAKDAVRTQASTGEVPLPHLVAAVEGGADGQLMREVVDYFYYAQIRAQGEETTAKRELLGAIHFSQLPNLLRALGYYPTELDIGHLTFEVANAYGPRDEPLAEVDVDGILLDFAQFMRLYVNYRPVFGITRQAIEGAFARIGADPITGLIGRDNFFQLLSTRGEPLHAAEVTAALTSLLGDGVRVDMLEDHITARAFAENLLGFEDYGGDAKGLAGGADNDEKGAGDDDSSLDAEAAEGQW